MIEKGDLLSKRLIEVFKLYNLKGDIKKSKSSI